MVTTARSPEQGLTVIELSVVIAIVGLLATIAIPRFMVFRGRAQQSEAKTGLASAAKALTVYRADHNYFTDDLGRIGWSPDGAPTYIIGFTTDGLPAASGRNDTAELKASGLGSFTTGRMVDGFGNPLTDGSLPAAPAAALAFTLGAAGNLDDDAALDLWTLDDSGELTHLADDNLL